MKQTNKQKEQSPSSEKKEWIAPKVIDLSLRETEGGTFSTPGEDLNASLAS